MESGQLELEPGSNAFTVWMYENGGATCLMLAWTYFGGYVNDNYVALFESLPLTRDHAYRLARNSFAAAFLDEETKAGYLRQVDDYFATA